MSMSSKWWIALVWIAACGRIGFDDLADAPSGDSVPPPPPIAVVQTASNFATTSALAVTLSSTGAGSTIIVATGGYNVGSPVLSIVDDVGNIYKSAQSVSVISTIAANDTVEIWYSTTGHAGATSVTVSAAQSQAREAWVIEATGLPITAPLEQVAAISNAPASAFPASPAISPTNLPALLVVIGDFAACVTGLEGNSKFTPLPLILGNAAAFLVATSPGDYAATWIGEASDTYCVSTATFGS